MVVETKIHNTGIGHALVGRCEYSWLSHHSLGSDLKRDVHVTGYDDAGLETVATIRECIYFGYSSSDVADALTSWLAVDRIVVLVSGGSYLAWITRR